MGKRGALAATFSTPASSIGLMATVLIAEDDLNVRTALERALRHEKHEIVSAADGLEALERVAEQSLDLIVLDVMMPNMDGITVCQKLREQGNQTPILIITAKHEVSDRVVGLDAGADDYLVKPFALDELFARMRALLRRTSIVQDELRAKGDGSPLQLADLEIDSSTRTVTRAGKKLNLTKMEFDLLELLVFNAGVVLTREAIYEKIWGYDFATNSKSLDVYVGYLRRKTEDGELPRLLHTVWGVGYVVREPEEGDA